MKRILLSFLLLSSLPGCNVLDKEPLPTIAPENFFRNADDAEAALTAAYDALQAVGLYGQDLNVVGEMPSDNCTSANGDVAALENLNWTPQTGQVNNVYRDAFVGINRANAVLKYVPAVPMNEGRRNEILGEAHFLRALHYFNLVRLYGGVPLRLEPTETGEPGAVTRVRSPAEQVYDQVLSDLEQARTLTAATFGNQALNRTRAIKTTASALRAKVLLARGEWAGAAAAAREVINSGLYELVGDFKALFPPNNGAESIFEVQFSGNEDGGFILPDLLLPSPPATYSFPKFNIPTPELVGQYADTVNDRRWRFTGQVTPAGRDHSSFVRANGRDRNDNGYFVYKWPGNPNGFNSPDNYYLLRLADVLLMHAEALNEGGGPGPEALGSLNAVRRRAGLPELTLADLPTQGAFRAQVDRERRLELAFEGERWFDLLRYARHEQGGADHPVTALDLIGQRRGTPDPNYLLFPLPQHELNNNPLAEQNLGY